MSNINWNFISEQEGRRRKKGYIPKNTEGVVDSSGVTIATGWDVGQMSREELSRSGLSKSIINKMIDFAGKKGQDSLAALDKFGIPIIEDEEAVEIDKYTHTRTLSSISKKYEEDSGKSFDSLSKAQQTVLASVAFQYGSNLKSATKNFWRQVTSGDWDAAIKNLENFGDKYSSRRNREADLLKEERSVAHIALEESKKPKEPKKQISFSDAFKEARSSLGAGKEFEWDGKMYSTNTQEDEIIDNMKKEEKQSIG